MKADLFYLEEFREYLQENQHAPSAIQNKVNSVKRYASWCEKKGHEVLIAEYSTIQHYIDFMKLRGNSTHTQNCNLGALKHYFNFLRGIGIIDRNPIANLIIKGTSKQIFHQIISTEQLENIYYQQPDNTPLEIRNKIIIGLYVFQGIPSSGLKGIEPGHLNIREGVIEIPESRTTARRFVKLMPMQMILLDRYIRETREILLSDSKKGRSNLLLFSQGTGSSLHNVLQQLAKAIKPYDYKQIRASVITHWIRKEGIRKAQYLAGHKHISSTEKYQVNDLEGLTNDLKIYRPRLGTGTNKSS